MGLLIHIDSKNWDLFTGCYSVGKKQNTKLEDLALRAVNNFTSRNLQAITSVKEVTTFTRVHLRG